jgi:hypothetical protein
MTEGSCTTATFKSVLPKRGCEGEGDIDTKYYVMLFFVSLADLAGSVLRGSRGCAIVINHPSIPVCLEVREDECISRVLPGGLADCK